MTLTRLVVCVLLLASLCGGPFASRLRAAVTCPPVFGDGMVLQRGLPVPVWGSAGPGERVRVLFAGQVVEAVADGQGKWRLELAPLEASAESRSFMVCGENTLHFSDVLVGEVWLCSGQSNMAKQLGPRSGQRPTDGHEQELAPAGLPLLRLFQSPRDGRQREGQPTNRWHRCSPAVLDALPFTAAGYHFGRRLQEELGVPVGLLHASVGGTRIELWTPPGAYAGMPELAAYDEASRNGARVDGTTISGLYLSMVEPLRPYALRGFLWYQGESNLFNCEGAGYALKMRALVHSWRAAWGRPEAAFHYVQLAPYLYSERARPRTLAPEALPLLWEAQTKALEQLPGSGMAVITDTVSDLKDIHPTNKRAVGERLAGIALAETYGRSELLASGPVFQSAKVEGAEVVVEFRHDQGLHSRDGKPLTEFLVAGADRRFVPARAEIVGRVVRVGASGVEAPAAVRLGWHEAASPNLVNAAGLPARSFRTDDWPVETVRPARSSDGILDKLPLVQEPRIPDRVESVVDHGAVGDGRTSCTAAFASAIKAVVAKGGGRVVVPSGVWLTGPLVLQSRVELHLEKGALLQFSDQREEYPLVQASFEGQAEWRCQSPISGIGLEDIAITGEGVVDGSGQVWRPMKRSKETPEAWAARVSGGGIVGSLGHIWYPSEGSREGNELGDKRRSVDAPTLSRIKDSLRPVLVSLRECRRVRLEGVTFRNSPAWTLHPHLCENLIIRRVQVNAPWNAQNSDALDVDSCRNVLVEDSLFDVGDDAICLKSGKNEEGRKLGRPTENVTVRNCRVLHGHGGFVIGSEMSGGVRNVHVSDCDFRGTDVGLRFKSTRGRGGVVENIHIERIRMQDILRDAIVFDLFYGGRSPTEEAPSQAGEATLVPAINEGTPAFRNLVISGIHCRGAGRAAFMQGLPEMPLENLRLQDLDIEAREGLVMANADGVLVQGLQVVCEKGPVLELKGVRSLHVLNSGGHTSGPETVLIKGRRTSGLDFIGSFQAQPMTLAPEVSQQAVRRR